MPILIMWHNKFLQKEQMKQLILKLFCYTSLSKKKNRESNF